MDNLAIRKAAIRVLADPDFRAHQPDPGFDLLKWLNKFFNFKMPHVHGQPPSGSMDFLIQALRFALISLCVLVVIYLVYWLYKKCKTYKRTTFNQIEISVEKRQEAQDFYLTQSFQAFESQDYRLAIHLLFLAAVALVIRDSHFHLTDFMTNREMVANTDFSAFPALLEPGALFQEMVYFDEPRWFGQGEVIEADYWDFKKIYTQFTDYLSEKSVRQRYA